MNVSDRPVHPLIEKAVLLAALATIPLVMLQARGVTGAWLTALDWTVWAVFAGALGHGIRTSPDWKRYLQRHPIDVAVVVLSLPLLPSVLALSRLVQLAKLLRLGLVVSRAVPALRATLGRREVLYVAALAVLLVFTAAGALAVLEPEAVGGSFGASLWWAVVTITTVGYGDIAPTGTAARMVAAVLMIAGLGLLSTLSASIAAFFVGQQQREAAPEPDARVLEALARLEARVEELSRRL